MTNWYHSITNSIINQRAGLLPPITTITIIITHQSIHPRRLTSHRAAHDLRPRRLSSEEKSILLIDCASIQRRQATIDGQLFTVGTTDGRWDDDDDDFNPLKSIARPTKISRLPFPTPKTVISRSWWPLFSDHCWKLFKSNLNIILPLRFLPLQRRIEKWHSRKASTLNSNFSRTQAGWLGVWISN